MPAVLNSGPIGCKTFAHSTLQYFNLQALFFSSLVEQWNPRETGNFADTPWACPDSTYS